MDTIITPATYVVSSWYVDKHYTLLGGSGDPGC